MNTLGLKDCSIRRLERRGEYNDIRGEYSSVSKRDGIERYIKVEVAHRIKEYPYEIRVISSYIGDYLHSKYGLTDEYGLAPFKVYTISLYRTFVDKLFAIADYYMAGKVKRYSRHLYDVYKLILSFNWNDMALVKSILDLKDAVRIDRQGYKKCLSAQDGINLWAVLYEALNSDFYKKDYQEITQNILFESVTYEQCKQTILSFLNAVGRL